jgi:tetratricopeptide (TPR) repeat protein
VKRNKGVSITTAAALVVLAAVLGVAYYSNYQQRVLAETARGQAEAAQKKAEDNYQAFLAEQEEKNARTKKSAPAFLRAAQLMTNEKKLDDALVQVTFALDADPSLTDAYLLKGQLLIGLERYAEAEPPLRAFLKRKPDDALVGKLADLAARPVPDKAAYFWSLWEVFDKQKSPVADRMTRLAERFAAPGKALLENYQKRINGAPGWAGLGQRLYIDKNGDLHLSFYRLPQVRDLAPLKGMKLSTLNLEQTPVRDLSPLKGMPLTRLDMRGCREITDLSPLADMKLTWLNLDGCAGVKDLTPLRGMKELTGLNLASLSKLTDLAPLRGLPLTYLCLAGCQEITDVEPLRGMPLTTLDCFDFRGMKIRSLEPLRGMKLKLLYLGGGTPVKDLSPLRNMPLESLILYGLPNLRDFEPLRGLPLTRLDLYAATIRSVDVLKGMPLTWLSLSRCGNVEDLTPLAGMKLTHLYLDGLAKVEDLKPLEGMPLKDLNLTYCQKVRSFEPLRRLPLSRLYLIGCQQLTSLDLLRDMKQLEHLDIRGCEKLRDLGPLKNLKLKTIALTPRFIDPKSMDLLRGMNLDRVTVEGRGDFAAPEFWKKYAAGEFAK